MAAIAIVISVASAVLTGFTFLDQRESNEFAKDVLAWDELQQDVSKYARYRHRIGMNLNRPDVQKDVWPTKSWIPFCQKLAQLENDIEVNRLRLTSGIIGHADHQIALQECISARDELIELWNELRDETGWNRVTTTDRARLAWLWEDD